MGRLPRDAGLLTAQPPLALFDLDNTLIDRVAAFRRWAEAFAADHGLADGAVDWLEAADEDGLPNRERFLERVRAHFGLDDPVAALVAAYDEAYPRAVGPAGAETFTALAELRERGWRIGIVTNGPPSQLVKIEVSGLAEAVDGWAISALVGAHKPDPEVFHAAAAACGCALGGAWVIGDSAPADIGGAHACGLRSIWITRGRDWPELGYRPDFTAETIPEAVRHLLA